MEIKNRILSDDEFFQQRKEVLAQWPTGKDVDLEEAVKFHKGLPSGKNAFIKLFEGKKNGVTQEFCSTGSDTIESHTNLLQYMQKEGGIDIATTYIDSFTRTGRFEMADKALKEAISTGKKMLNGFPFVSHGVIGTRKIVEAIDIPVLSWGPAPDLRLVNEVAFAGGHTGFSGGPLFPSGTMQRTYPLWT